MIMNEPFTFNTHFQNKLEASRFRGLFQRQKHSCSEKKKEAIFCYQFVSTEYVRANEIEKEHYQVTTNWT